jgi:hypothetical protein
MAGVLPCWVVDVRHERNSGRLGHFRSRPLTFTEARRIARTYEATGTPATLRCVEELAELHRFMIQGVLGWREAVGAAKSLGYDVE